MAENRETCQGHGVVRRIKERWRTELALTCGQVLVRRSRLRLWGACTEHVLEPKTMFQCRSDVFDAPPETRSVKLPRSDVYTSHDRRSRRGRRCGSVKTTLQTDTNGYTRIQKKHTAGSHCSAKSSAQQQRCHLNPLPPSCMVNTLTDCPRPGSPLRRVPLQQRGNIPDSNPHQLSATRVPPFHASAKHISCAMP